MALSIVLATNISSSLIKGLYEASSSWTAVVALGLVVPLLAAFLLITSATSSKTKKTKYWGWYPGGKDWAERTTAGVELSSTNIARKQKQYKAVKQEVNERKLKYHFKPGLKEFHERDRNININ